MLEFVCLGRHLNQGALLKPSLLVSGNERREFVAECTLEILCLWCKQGAFDHRFLAVVCAGYVRGLQPCNFGHPVGPSMVFWA